MAVEIRDSFAELLYRVARRLRAGAVFPKRYRRDLILQWIEERTS